MFLCLLYRAKFKFYWFGAQISHKHIQYSISLLYFFQAVFSWSDVKSKCYKTTIDIFYFYQFSSVQSLSHVRLFAIPWIAACQASLSITNSRSSPKPMSIQSVMPSNHLILCHPLLLLPSIFPSIRVFSNESVLRIRWPKYWSCSASASVLPMDTQDWSLGWAGWISLQSKGLSRVFSNTTKASIIWHSAFFIVQLSHPYMTTRKTVALTTWTFIGKVMSLLYKSCLCWS